ncbi:hypothetical protein FKW77_000265 [Venturia effusa]|uniref:Uncharacterized protein n=1 Tax=Venturia effusa TaxID=50376 RepID=A0A517LBT0_9PEZI|nr:hypothetical protein FKW77_000265 [Venturia effusa]
MDPEVEVPGLVVMVEAVEEGISTSPTAMPGVGVSIVLKIDQPTGRQVQGIVGDVLTSGDHPRGIKVRLQDGRIGRVQQLVDAAVAQTPSDGQSNLGQYGEESGATHRTVPQQRSTPRGRQYSDIRQDGFDYDNETSSRAPPSLLDFVRQPKQTKRSKAAAVRPTSAERAVLTEPVPPLAVCPPF